MLARNLVEVMSRHDRDGIHPDRSIADLRRQIFDDSTIVILKNAFSGGELEAFRRSVSTWAKTTPARSAQTYADENFHAIERGVSPRQKTLHLYHAFNFPQIDALPMQYAEPILKIYEPLRALYCQMVDRETRWNETIAGAKLRPQVIQYPRGGGFLATHVHPLEPQLIGFILSISKRGLDFETGAVGFEAPDGHAIDTSDHHGFGDIVMFRFDLKHWVTPVDMDAALDIAGDKGRWVVTLPLN